MTVCFLPIRIGPVVGWAGGILRSSYCYEREKNTFLVALKKQSNKKRCMAWHKMRRYLLANLRQIDLQCFAGSKFACIAKFGSYCLTDNLLRGAHFFINFGFEKNMAVLNVFLEVNGLTNILVRHFNLF